MGQKKWRKNAVIWTWWSILKKVYEDWKRWKEWLCPWPWESGRNSPTWKVFPGEKKSSQLGFSFESLIWKSLNVCVSMWVCVWVCVCVYDCVYVCVSVCDVCQFPLGYHVLSGSHLNGSNTTFSNYYYILKAHITLCMNLGLFKKHWMIL